MKQLLLLTVLLSSILVIGCGKDESSNPAAPTMDPPSGLTAVVLNDHKVQLDWDNNSYNAYGFHVWRVVAGGSDWATVETVGVDTTVFTDESAVEGTAYSYRVTAYIGATDSHPSNKVDVRTFPRAPQGLTATQNEVVKSQIDLAWVDTSNVETGYQIQHKVGRDWLTLDELEANATGYQDDSLETNKTYYYRVRAMMDSVGSVWSSEVNAKTTDYTPLKPSNLTAVALNYSSIKLDWTYGSDADGFVIEHSLSSGSGWEEADSLPATTVTFTDRNRQAATTYYFRIHAYNGYGKSGYAEALATTPDGPPLAPSGLTAQAISYSEILLSWNDNSSDELGFEIWRKSGGGSGSEIATTETDVNYFTDNTVGPSTIYNYKVRSFKYVDSVMLFSPYSAEVSATTPVGPPATPQGLTAEAVGKHEIRVSWSAVQGAENIVIERKTGPGNWNQLQLLNGNATGFQDNLCDIDTWYSYRVKSLNEVFESDYSIPDSAITVDLETPHVFDDGFEAHALNQPPPVPWSQTVAGTSSAFVTDAEVHQGSQSVDIHDPDDDGTSFVWLIADYDQTAAGVISCWLYIPANAFLGVIGTDGSATNLISFRMQFNADGTYLYQLGANFVQGGNYPTDQWFHMLVFFNVADNRYSISFDNQMSLLNAQMVNSGLSGNAQIYFTTFSDVVTPDAYVDDVMVSTVVAARMSVPPPDNSNSGGGVKYRLSDVGTTRIR